MRLLRFTPIMLLTSHAFLGGCSSHTSEPGAAQSYQPLVTLDGWSSVSRLDDPFVSDGEVPADCVGPGFRLEQDSGWLEIDTGLCNWVTLSGMALHPVEVGQMLELDVSHYDLNAAEPSAAELRLTFESCAAWSKTIPIPSAAAVYSERFPSPCAPGDQGNVLFHLHNHGQNTYQLRSLSVLR